MNADARVHRRPEMVTISTICTSRSIGSIDRNADQPRYDLGEFDQKGSVATKWGTKEELLKLAHTAKDNGVGIYWDAVLNHKFAADRKEKCLAQEVDQEDRTKFVSDKYEIDAWVGYDFPGRKDKYSDMKYHWYHFSGVDYNARNEKTAIYKIMGDKGDQQWAESVDDEKGN